MKIATLTYFIARHNDDTPDWVDGARRELCALLAVATAARALVERDVGDFVSIHSVKRLEAALDRLRRVSSPPRKRGRRRG